MEGDAAEYPSAPATVGGRLRAAREAQGIDLPELAARTRIPQRHLEAIDSSDYSGLPSSTYAIGFAKAYARAVGADEVAIARDLRRELGDRPERPAPVPAYELDDPDRVPSRGLAWAGVLVAVALLIGVGLWYGTDWFRGTAPPAEPLASGDNAATPAPVAATPTPAVAGGQVTLVATDAVWIRVSDGGKRLAERELASGERYDVPADAAAPVLRTSRPGALRVLVNASAVAPIGTGVETVEVPIGAAALQARGSASAPTAAAPSPAPSASPRAAPRRPAPATTPLPTPSAASEAAPGNATAP
jgi:cytoskeleton protein RodZ